MYGFIVIKGLVLTGFIGFRVSRVYRVLASEAYFSAEMVADCVGFIEC